MYIQIVRLKDDGKETIGTLSVNGTFECFTLEDTLNFPKVYGKTHIPQGVYEVKLRKAGSMHARYSKRYGDTHQGMIWLQDVENFEWVYIHVGNNEDDTDGCILVGRTCDSTTDRMSIGGSSLAYQELYPRIADELARGEKVTIQIV